MLPENKSAEKSFALAAGSVLNDRYVTVKCIGSGGFGITYLAYDTVDEKKVAVKEYFPAGIAIRSPDGITAEPISYRCKEDYFNGAVRFRNESELLLSLGDKTDVINMYDSFLQNGTVYYAMEYVNGVTIRDHTGKYGKMTEGQALYTAVKIASDFVHIHSRGIIHRDLSPNNIMIGNDGRVRLVDFGNARPFSYDETNSMTVVLKPGYAPLEQYRHHGKHGPWTDIYSLGAVLYYSLTLKDPEDPMARYNDDTEFRKGLSGIEPHFAGIIKKMTSLQICDRYKSSGELLKSLKALKLSEQSFSF